MEELIKELEKLKKNLLIIRDELEKEEDEVSKSMTEHKKENELSVEKEKFNKM